MFSKTELLDAIDELERSPSTYQNAEKLATFYLLYDHLYGDQRMMSASETLREVIIDKHGESEFLRQISGKDAESVWRVMDELMETIQMLQPRLYQATLERISE